MKWAIPKKDTIVLVVVFKVLVVVVLAFVLLTGIIGVGNEDANWTGSAVKSRSDDKTNIYIPNAFGSGPTAPVFLTGGANPAMNLNSPNRPVQSKNIPSEGIWLGMEIEQITPGTIQESNLPVNQTGIIVDSVPVGSLAEKAGLKNGDVITAINGQMIVNMADYIRATDNQKIKTGSLEIYRNGSELYLNIPSDRNEAAYAYSRQPMVNGGRATAPPITLDAVLTHGYRGVCAHCHQINDIKSQIARNLSPQTRNNSQFSGGLPSPAQQNAAGKVLVEGHWLGMELIPITPELAREYKLPAGADGLLVDEVTLEAAESGLLAGDILQGINNYPVKTLEDFAQATRKVESLNQANLGVLRDGQPQVITLRSSWYKLGVAQNEAAQPIQPSAISPHSDMGRPCTDCHIFMKNGGQLAIDAGDILPTPPPITSFDKAPHSDRGVCNVCHTIFN